MVWLTLLALVFAASPAQVLAATSMARIEGLLLDVNGDPATGFRVHLIDESGHGVAEAEVDADGLYSVKDLPAGSYALGIENPDGLVAPVAAPPVRVADGELARRDVKLMRGDAMQRDEIVAGNHGMGAWWAGLSTAAKVWTVVGIVLVIGITVAALDDEDDTSPSSP